MHCSGAHINNKFLIKKGENMNISKIDFSENEQISLEGFLSYINLPENEDKHFELIDGNIVMMSGNTSSNHMRICGYISRKIGNYLEGKTCEVFQDPNIFLYRDDIGHCKNVYQPDIIIGCDKDKMTDRGYEGTPDFALEVISKSTAYKDYFEKCGLYMLYGVKEYWIVDLKKNQIIVYLNGENTPEIQKYNFNDKIKINVLDDLFIDFKEILKIVDKKQ